MGIYKHLVPGLLAAAISSQVSAEEPTKLLFGDTHLHTSYSFDAYLNKNQTADPDTAYRWAKGMPVIHPYNRAKVQIQTPLDFLVVADHAELMGVIRAVNNGTAELEDMGLWGNFKRWLTTYVINDAIENESGAKVFNEILPRKPQQATQDPVLNPDNELPIPAFGDTTKTETTAWKEIVDAAERHNDPGTFTTFHGWEWSSIPVGANLHRIVFTPDSAEQSKQFLPYGSDQSQYPEDLWTWLEETQVRTGSRFVAIPHNSNISKGFMYAETTLKGAEITPEYAKRRLKWEPVSEVTQIKGDSETHPNLSPDDEFADFETYSYYIQQASEDYRVAPADYMRSGLKTGLAIEEKIGTNPYQFGVIGSTDSHSGLASAEEDNFWGKFARDSTPETKVSKDKLGGSKNTGWSMASSGLAAVWAKENTRDAIFDAFQRKEVYATTGTRLSVRVFGGWDMDESSLSADDFAEQGYQQGVPMGGTLSANQEGKAPQFLIRAVKDPNDANLDRVQVIKGWIDGNGEQREKIFNVAWSGDRQLDSNGKLDAVGNTVNLETAQYDNSIGAPELTTRWQDPDFDPAQRAFYYVRVLQIPTPRHGLYDAVALQQPQEGPATIQERAYTSPIWYKP
ncbi:DUF3604 domain-containing protein [Maricurvus nonylphenolicus]|uniref:DUF3604 domain-containing protein n=1 Tax=Maricurvus nonylphenolicus TaxID=1008307 RepID=UPI0036F2B6D6